MLGLSMDQITQDTEGQARIPGLYLMDVRSHSGIDGGSDVVLNGQCWGHKRLEGTKGCGKNTNMKRQGGRRGGDACQKYSGDRTDGARM